MIERDNLKKKATVSKTSRYWELYQKARNKTNNKIRETKRNYYISNINTSKRNSKATWKIVNSMRGKISKNTIIEGIEVNDINYTQPSEIAELFNKHFINVGHDLGHQIPPISKISRTNSYLKQALFILSKQLNLARF
jgi:hypothetical protein